MISYNFNPFLQSSATSEAEFEESCDGVLGVMETMLSVAYKQAINVITTGRSDRDVVAFNNLLSSLQISLLAWCHQQILAPNSPEGRHAAIFTVIKTYTQLMTNKAVALCRDALEMVARAREEAMATDEENPFDIKVLSQGWNGNKNQSIKTGFYCRFLLVFINFFQNFLFYP